MACSNVSIVLDILQIVYTLTLFTVAMGVFKPSCACKNSPIFEEFSLSSDSDTSSDISDSSLKSVETDGE